jgi:peptide/nickel transport system substrate-binding protein
MTTLARRTLRLLAPIMILLAACDARPAPNDAAVDAERPEVGGFAVLAERSDMSKPMPLLFATAVDAELQDVMFASLLRGAWQDGRLVLQTAEHSPMALAHAYEFTGADSTQIRFRMRAGLRWSDGTPITAHDVVFTYRMLADPATASPRQDFTEQLDAVVAQDDSTVVFRFARRYPDMLFHASHSIVPEHVFSRYDPAALAASGPLTHPADSLVVSGPFRVGDWRRNDRITLVRNPHFQPQPYLDAVVVRVIPDATTRLTEFLTGGIDVMRPVAFDQVALLRQQVADVRFEREEKRQYDYIAYNPKAFAPFADPEIRRALGLALDVTTILQALEMETFAVPAAGPYSPIFHELADERSTPPLGHDAARAVQILEARGWRDSDGDGILDKDGVPFRFTLLTNSGNQRRNDVSQIVQQQWRQIGVDVELRQQEWNTLFQRMQRHDYQAVLAGWQVGLSPDIGVFYETDSPFNIAAYQSAEVSRLIGEARAQPTEAAATPLWREAAARIAADQPYTWLYYLDQVNAVSGRLRGMRIDSYGAYQNPWEWWIPRERQGRAATTGADGYASPNTDER